MAIQEATPIALTADERAVLEGWVRAPKTEQRLVERARIVLLAGGRASEPGDRPGSRGHPSHGQPMAGAVRPGPPGRAGRRAALGQTEDLRRGRRSPHPGAARPAAARGLRALDRAVARRGAGRRQRPARLALPAGAADRPRRAQVLVPVERPRVRRQGRRHRRALPRSARPCDRARGRRLPGQTGWGPAPQPDRKPAIQALERAQGYLKLPNGRSLHGQAHEYKRRGTSTLFAALEVATGAIKAKHTKRRRRFEFLDFMNQVVADHPDREIHVVLDNLKTHKPKRDLWLARHKNVHFHFTPTHASWLNQVEIWFSILARSALDGASFTSVHQLRASDRRLHRPLQPGRHALPVAQGRGSPQRPRRKDYGLMMAGTRALSS